MVPVILFRGRHEYGEEYTAASQHFTVYESRAEIPAGCLVIPRYSLLPYASELERDLNIRGAKLVNTTAQHNFVADISRWQPILHDITPETYALYNRLPEGAYIVKGRTNSRKFEWNRRCFAPDRASIRGIVESLMDDALIAEQGIVVRRYYPLETFTTGINGLPITNEYRFFALNGKVLTGGYYWANEPDFAPAEMDPKALELAQEAATRVSQYINFVVVDVAKTQEGKWIVIELNDGSMSGISMIPPNELYYKLRRAFDKPM